MLHGLLILSAAMPLLAGGPLPEISRHAAARPAWTVAPWVQGGAGLAARSEFRFVVAGLRVGRILTHERGTGRLRGTFEVAADLIPVFSVRQPDVWVYGGSFGLALRWNFTAARAVVPYLAAEGGLLVSTANVPPGETSRVNFTPGGAFGLYVPVARRQSLDCSVRVTHISNGALSDFNPGINASLQLRIGYTWFR